MQAIAVIISRPLRKKGLKDLRLIFKSRTDVGYDMKMLYNNLLSVDVNMMVC